MTRFIVEVTIQKNLQDPQFCVTQLAVLLKVSNSQLRKEVHALFHTSPQKLIQYHRICTAAMMLCNQEKVQNVSRSVGYSSSRSLRTVFHQYCGMAPISYKKLSRTDKPICMPKCILTTPSRPVKSAAGKLRTKRKTKRSSMSSQPNLIQNRACKSKSKRCKKSGAKKPLSPNKRTINN